MNIRFLGVSLLFFGLLSTNPFCSAAEGNRPTLIGKAEGRFQLGELLYQDDFENLDNWILQIEEKKAPAPRVESRDNTLDCYLPNRGGTIWFRKKLKNRLIITYDVICPKPAEDSIGIMAKDVNNFWLASDPLDPEKGLFNKDRYNGSFRSYNKMNGYYASSGGGKNTTTRLRRYPRERDGKPAKHIALKDKDGKKEFLLQPGKLMKVQLVAYDDLVQYIVDGKLVYEIASGEEVTVERFHNKEKKIGIDDYDKEYPFYREGFFGFRMVGSHHIYSNFQVYELEPNAPKKPIEVSVSSLEELRKVATKSDQIVTMKPGLYVHTEMPDESYVINFSGSRNIFKFSDVTFEMPVSVLSKGPQTTRSRRRRFSIYGITGDNVTLRGAKFINTYPKELPDEIDFGAYNQNKDNFPARTVTEITIKGEDCRLEDCHMTVRGSFPYGYGNMFGIGPNPAVPLRKHNGILLNGDRSVVDGCHVKMESFGHAIFAQSGDNLLVKNTSVEGSTRLSDDFLEETKEGSLGAKFDHRIQWPENVKDLLVPSGHMINLSEDGIRAYPGAKKMTVENCHVRGMRGGIKLYMADEAVIRNCEVLDCVIQGFSVPNRGIIENCRGNAAYGPLLYIHMDSHHHQRIELEVLSASHGTGDHPLAAIKGHSHRIKFTSQDSSNHQLERPIIIGYPMRFDYLSSNYPEVPEGMSPYLERFGPDKYRAERIRLQNETDYPVVLGELAKGNRIHSKGEISNLGKRNRISSPKKPRAL